MTDRDEGGSRMGESRSSHGRGGKDTPPRHVLEDPSPEFLCRLDDDPERAWKEFHEFAWRLFVAWPPPVFRDLSKEIRDDITAEIVMDCRSDNFRKLRSYRNRGLPFAAWLARLARNRALDLQRREKLATRNPGPSPAPISEPQDEKLRNRALIEAVREAMHELGQQCRLLLQAAADELRPSEIADLLGLPSNDNKRISDALRACRKTLRKILNRRGFGNDLLGLEGS